VLQENNIKFYCALYKGIILDVFELDNTKPWMRIREAVRKGIIIPDKEGYRIKGFNYRIISSSEFDESRVFLFGHLAHEIREPYLGKKVIGIEHPGPFRYLHKIDQAPQN
jgi:mRNA-degrading endonuclease RelE of RelBE toxin-antitoxin system